MKLYFVMDKMEGSLKGILKEKVFLPHGTLMKYLKGLHEVNNHPPIF